MPQLPQTKAEKWIGRTLRVGVWTSASLMSIGLLITALLRPDSSPIFPDAILWPPTALTFIHSGLLLLMLTPFLRVTTTLLSFFFEKDWKFVSVSFLVFSMLLVELIFAFR